MRLAGPDDAEQVWAVQREGFEGYGSFAPAGWEPPDPSSGLQMARERLASRDVWCLIAEADGAPAGHVAMMPASQHPHRISDEPGLIHFWQLFVRPPWHGSGLAGGRRAVRGRGLRDEPRRISPRGALTTRPRGRG